MHCKVSLTILLFFSALGAQAQTPEYSEHISRTFPISSFMTVDIANKYGRIQVIPWDKDSVQFNIEKRIRAKDAQKLEKLKRNVEFEFTPGQYYVLVRTKFGDGGSDMIKDIVDIAGSYLSSSNSVTINYTVMVPPRVALKIENKFGDVYFDDLDGSLSLILSYGNMKADRLDGRSEIKLTSGDCEINYVKDGQLDVSYGNVHITDAGKLLAQTRSSNVSIDKAISLKLDTRRDKIYLNSVASLSGNSYFSGINLVSLQNDLSFVCRYGNLTVNSIRRSFSMIDISSEFTDLALAFEKPASFTMELTHHQDVQFIYPRAISSLSTKVLDAENKLFTTSGTFGTGSPEAEVVIKATRKCSVTISQR